MLVFRAARSLAAKVWLIWRRAIVFDVLRALVWSRHTVLRIEFDVRTASTDFGVDEAEPPRQGIGRFLRRVGRPHVYRLRRHAPGDITVQRGAIETLRRYRESAPVGSLPSEFYVDLTHGAGPECLWLARIGDEVAGLLWVFGAEHPSPFVRLEPDMREIRKVWVLPQHRGRAVFIAMIASLVDLEAEGVRTVVGHIRADNPASLGSVLRFGGRVAGELEIRRVLGFVFRRFTPHAAGTPLPKALRIEQSVAE